MTECSVAEGQCDRESQCGVRGSWQQISSVLDNALRGVSLADMLKPPRTGDGLPHRDAAGEATTE